ncbi:MAG: hypothetical protein ACO3K7_06175 [Candidatus Marinamargulisbacteria bacterium]
MWGLSYILWADSLTQGYKDRFYQLNSKAQTLCEQTSTYSDRWCVNVQENSQGMYIGFKRVVVYSKKRIQSIDTIRKEAVWALPLDNVAKVHINYPVILVWSLDQTLAGYDYFSGLLLWRLPNTVYTDTFETRTDAWLVKDKTLHKIDVMSGDTIDSVILKGVPTKVIGNDIYLYYRTNQQLFHHNLYSKVSHLVGDSFQVRSKSSHLVWAGNRQTSQLRTFDNRIVSSNVQTDLITVYTPTKSYFAVIQEQKVILLDDRQTIIYEFTPPKNEVMISYAYKLNNKLHVFYKGGQDVWVLKRQNKFDQDT